MKRTLNIYSGFQIRHFNFGIILFLISVFTVRGKGIESPSDIHPWSVGINISTFGPGVHMSKLLNDKFAIRLAYNYFRYNYPLEKLNNELQGDALFHVGGPSVSFEYYLLKRLYFAGGIRYNQTKARLNGQMAESVFIGDIEMYPEEIGLVKVALDPGLRFVPYIGIGYGRGVPLHKRISYSFEVGMFYHGEPRVDLTTTGMLTPTSSEEQETLIENNISPLKYWPIVSLRVMYKLNFE